MVFFNHVFVKKLDTLIVNTRRKSGTQQEANEQHKSGHDYNFRTRFAVFFSAVVALMKPVASNGQLVST